jgi:deoxyribose-phosphate aldolase
VVSFPFGLSTTEAKVQETKIALAHGATEIDMVMNYSALRSNQQQLVREDIKRVVEAAKAVSAKNIVKVILENCYLTDEQKVQACSIVAQAKADFVKTSTGFGAGGATVEDISLMRRTVGPVMGVKAAGGVKTLDQVIQMVEAGATRIGTSSSVYLIQSLTK